MDVTPDVGAQVRLRCFGELEIVRPDGTDITPLFLLPRRAALFLYLALADPPQPKSRAALAEMFWPFLVAGTARHALDQSLFSLHQYLGEVWDAVDEDDAVVLVRRPIWCDVWVFREAITRGEWQRATALYRGPLLDRPGLFGAGDFQTWLEEERERLRREAIAAFAQSALPAARAGDWWTAVRCFRDAARAEPLDEENLRCLMVALVQAGDRASALRAFELLRRRLEVRFGRKPARESTTLAEIIRDGATPPLEPFLPA
jgi:DNA-binding SARP family transcriptional activator